MKIRKWKSPMTVGNEKLFKSRRRRTHKRSSRRRVDGVWRGQPQPAGQSEWSIEIQRDFSISKPFLSMQNNGTRGRGILSFLCVAFCESKSLQFKRVFVCVAINCEYLQPSPPARAPWPCSRTGATPMWTLVSLNEPGLRLMRDPELTQFPWHIHSFRINFNLSADPGTGQRWQGVSGGNLDQWATAAQPPISISVCVSVCVLAAQRTAGVTKVWKCGLIRESRFEDTLWLRAGIFGAHFELCQLPKLGI